MSSILEQCLGHRFADSDLLEQALTHRSAGARHNERLEFLGDGLLNFVIADRIFQLRPRAPEGDLSRLRACLVNRSSLADLGRALDLGGFVRLGGGELKSGGQRRDSILADALEAVLGAVYLDAGFETARTVILDLYRHRLAGLPDSDDLKDPKTRLQEYLQRFGKPLPRYEVVAERGEPHARIFQVECRTEDPRAVCEGEAGNRRHAEQQAAERMLERLSGETPGEASHGR